MIHREKQFHLINHQYIPFFMLALPFVFIEPAPVDIFTIIFTLFLLFYGFVRKSIVNLALIYTFFIFVSFIFVIFIQGELSENTFPYIRYFFVDIFILIIFIIFTSLAFYKDFNVENALKWYFYGAAISSALVLFFYFVGTDIVFREYGLRLKGFFKDPNVLAPYLASAIIIGWYFLFSSKQIVKFIVPSILIMLFCLFLTGSRGGYLTLMFSFIFYLFLMPQSNSKLFILIAMGLISASLLLFITTNPDAFLVQRFELQDYDDNRFSAFSEFIKIAIEYPLGYGAAFAAYELSQDDLIASDRIAHNIIINKAVNSGIFSCVILVVFLIASCLYGPYKSFRLRNKKYIILGIVLITTLINSMAIDSGHWRHFFVLASIMLGSVMAGRIKIDY